MVICEGTLMCKDRPLAKIIVTDMGAYSAERIESDGKYFPWEMREECSGLTLKKFCEERLTPPTRQHIDKDLLEYGYEEYSHAAILLCSNGRDCSDPFWIRFAEGPQTWKEVWEVIGVVNKV